MPDVELREGGTVPQVQYGGGAGEVVGGDQQRLEAGAVGEALQVRQLVVGEVQDAEEGQARQALNAGEAVVLQV